MNGQLVAISSSSSFLALLKAFDLPSDFRRFNQSLQFLPRINVKAALILSPIESHCQASDIILFVSGNSRNDGRADSFVSEFE